MIIYKKTDGFYHGKTKIIDPTILEYIKNLVIPPAYQDVEIYYKSGKHSKILYSGTDAAGREQFIYSEWWGEQQQALKLCNLIKFGEMLPQIQADIVARLKSGDKWTQTRIIALILRVISLCNFRVGQEKYTKLYESFGISTVHRKHLKFGDDGAKFEFIGKKSQLNACTVVDPVAIGALKNLLDRSADQNIFSYQLGKHWVPVKATEINDYLKTYDPVITSKMFRTWDTNIQLIKLLGLQDPTRLAASGRRKAVVAALREVSLLVHNTPAIARKAYADPEIIKMYLEHPRTYKKVFITPASSERIRFMNWLKSKCSTELLVAPPATGTSVASTSVDE